MATKIPVSLIDGQVSNGESVQPPLSRNVYGECGGTGLLNGSATESGSTWQVNGPGGTTAVRNAGGYATSTENAYCFLQASAPIRRAVQVFSGPTCTTAIGLDDTLQNMIHVNVSSNGYAGVLYWKTGVGTSLVPQHSANCNKTGNLDDGQPHEYAIEIVGNYCWCFVDGVLITVSYDPHFSSLQGPWAFGQLHGGEDANLDKLYSLTTFTDTQPTQIAKTVASIVPDMSRTNAPLVGCTLRVGDGSSRLPYDLDLMASVGIIRNTSQSLVLKLWSGEGYSTELQFGNDPDPTNPGDILGRYTDILGLRVSIDGQKAVEFPHSAIAPYRMYTESIGFGEATNPNTPALLHGTGNPENTVSAPPGSVFLSDDGNVYRKSTGIETTGWIAM